MLLNGNQLDELGVGPELRFVTGSNRVNESPKTLCQKHRSGGWLPLRIDSRLLLRRASSDRLSGSKIAWCDTGQLAPCGYLNKL